MSPTYNNHFRQFTKKASKTAVSSALGATRSHRRSFVDYAGDDAPAKSRTLFCLGWHFNYNMTKAHKIDWTTSGYKTGTANTASSSIVDKIVLSGLDTSATYLALGEIWVNNTSGSVKDFDAYITGLTTEEHLQTTQLWWNNFSFHSVIKPNNDAEIKLRYNSNGIAPNRARLTVIRIG